MSGEYQAAAHRATPVLAAVHAVHNADTIWPSASASASGGMTSFTRRTPRPPLVKVPLFSKNDAPGGRCVFSSDYDKFSQQTYEANFGEKPHGDIHAVAAADIPQHDILCGGFPCQPFSIASVSKKLSLVRKHGFEDVKQGNLFFSIADILDFHRPAAFVLENVKNLKGHDGGKTFDIIYRTLTEHLGYTVYCKIIDAQSVVPQRRERIFFVGSASFGGN